MGKEYKKYLYIFDLLPSNPQLRIFNHDRYKSIFSSILSIILILLSLTFIILSLIEFFKHENPNVIYSKNNDDLTNRTILIKDSLLIFGLIENNNFTAVQKEDSYLEAELKITYKNGKDSNTLLTLEYCEFGKNLDIKYKDKLSSFSDSINNYYCFSKKDGNLPLFYDPNFGESSLYVYARLTDKSKYNADELMILIINGNDIINHNSKKNPISDNYFTYSYTSFSIYKFSLINYYLQFIKYESDNGLFFPSNHLYNAKSFSYSTTMMTNYIGQIDNLHIGTIMISISKVNFDSYKRNYPRIQTLIAEIMSVISLIFGVFNFFIDILLDKQISIDITKYLLNKANINKLKNEENNINLDETKDIDKETQIDLKINKIDNSQKDFSINASSKTELTNVKTMDKLNYFHIIISYFCCKNRKAKLINLCQDLIEEDLCIENIFSRLYELERKVNLLSNKKNQNNKLDEINNCIYEIENNIDQKT